MTGRMADAGSSVPAGLLRDAAFLPGTTTKPQFRARPGGFPGGTVRHSGPEGGRSTAALREAVACSEVVFREFRSHDLSCGGIFDARFVADGSAARLAGGSSMGGV